jgi:hypothetical protein
MLPVLALLVLFGCGRVESGGTGKTPPPMDTLKASLQEVVAGKAASSAIMGAIQELKKTDPAKAEALQKDAGELMALSHTNPKEAPAKAKQMLEKLESTK